VTERRASTARNPDRRLAPRPLPAHLAAAMILWLSSRAALPFLKSVSQSSSELRALAAEIDAFGPASVAAALDGEISERDRSYLPGLETYRRHPFRRPDSVPPVLWREGTTRLLDYGRGAAGRVILVVPSLINRYYVLDILPERSFLGHLAAQGLRPVVVDWGAPGSDERDFDLTDYIVGRLETAFDRTVGIAGAPIGVIGYCMGGLLALALALRRQDQLGCLALLATPWDFHAERAAQARLLAHIAECLAGIWDEQNSLPVEVIQGQFLLLDPFTAERKFTRFAAMDAEGEEARSFVALEDWLNDGVPLALGVARDCARSWYGENEPGRGLWRVGGRPVEPKLLRRPALVVVPSRDRIVPPSSAEPLAAALGAATVSRPRLGHVGIPRPGGAVDADRRMAAGPARRAVTRGAALPGVGGLRASRFDSTRRSQVI
jgi:polyhydroxyalkanoate synthase subunit PhaC